MIYVDLNPVRAAMATSPEESDFTGAKDRIDDLRVDLATGDNGQINSTLSSSEHSIHDWAGAFRICWSHWSASVPHQETAGTKWRASRIFKLLR